MGKSFLWCFQVLTIQPVLMPIFSETTCQAILAGPLLPILKKDAFTGESIRKRGKRGRRKETATHRNKTREKNTFSLGKIPFVWLFFILTWTFKVNFVLLFVCYIFFHSQRTEPYSYLMIAFCIHSPFVAISVGGWWAIVLVLVRRYGGEEGFLIDKNETEQITN